MPPIMCTFFAGGMHALSSLGIAHSRDLVHLICFLLLFLIRGRTEGTEGECSVSPFAVGFLLSLCSCCPYSLAIYFVNKQSACNYSFFLISTMSDFSRKAKEEQPVCRINPFYTQLCYTSFNDPFQ